MICSKCSGKPTWGHDSLRPLASDHPSQTLTSVRRQAAHKTNTDQASYMFAHMTVPHQRADPALALTTLSQLMGRLGDACVMMCE